MSYLNKIAMFSLSLVALNLPVDAGSKPVRKLEKKVNIGFRPAVGIRNINSIIVHSSYNVLDRDTFSVDGVLKEYRMYKVAAHYLIDREGNIIQLVQDNDIAFHAGKSWLPNGQTNVNATSIGIELINTLYCGPNEHQYSALNFLIDELKSRYKIDYILGHKDIAPGRKTDPWNFDWSRVKHQKINIKHEQQQAKVIKNINKKRA